MMPFRRRSDAARTATISASQGRYAFLAAILKILALPALILVLLITYGTPALRVQYWYHGSREHPEYTRCIYLSIHGWHDHKVGLFDRDPCPVFAFFPFDIRKLLRDS